MTQQTQMKDERVREFIAAYKEEFGEELPPGEASILLGQLVQLYLKISQRLPDETPIES